MLGLVLALQMVTASPEVKVGLTSGKVGDTTYRHTVAIRNDSRHPLGMVVLQLDHVLAFGGVSNPAAADTGWKGMAAFEHQGPALLITFKAAKRPFHSFPIPVGGTRKFHFQTRALDSLPMELGYSIFDSSGAWHEGKVVAEPGPDSLGKRP